MGQKQLCQVAGRCGNESFKPGMTREGDDDLQSSNKVVDHFGKEVVQGDV